MYYTPVDEFTLEDTTLKGAVEYNIIPNEELSAMTPDDKNPSKFYCNFKVHKKTEHKEVPPARPIRYNHPIGQNREDLK